MKTVVTEMQAPSYLDADFTMICQDDSMIRSRISAGDLVYIRTQKSVEDGEIGVILDGNTAFLGRIWTYPNCLMLRPDDPRFPSRTYSGKQLEQVAILGRVVGFTSIIA